MFCRGCFVVGSCFWVLVFGFLLLGVLLWALYPGRFVLGSLFLGSYPWRNRPLRYLLVLFTGYRLRVKVFERFRERVFAGEGGWF